MKPQNFEEKVVWYYILGTYGFYFLGAQYIFAALMAWFLILYLVKKRWNQKESTPPEEKVTIPSTVWVWIIFLSILELILIIGHLDFDLGVAKIITQSISFARTWALWALFPLIGCLNIRPQLLYRAVCILCLQSLVFILVGYVGLVLHLPGTLYTSPLWFLGRSDEKFYQVHLYQFDYENNQFRLPLFTPWAPALGLVGNIYFFLARQESNKKWRWIGMIGATAMIVVSVSRLSVLCLPTVLLLNWVSLHFTQPILQIQAGVVSFFAGIFVPVILNFVETFRDQVNSFRPDSSRVRETLGRMALDRWWNEAPLWGHGALETQGPKVTGLVPIGSHHAWFGLLYSYGLLGFIAFLVPLLWSFIDLFNKLQKSTAAKVGFSVLLVIFIFTFGENIETLAYLYWPGLVLMGIVFKERI